MKKKVEEDPKAKKKAAKAEKTVNKSEQKTSSRVEPKQVIVGIVILCFAALLLVLSFADMKKSDWLASFFDTKKVVNPYQPKNVIVVFNTTTTKKVDYQIYYTVERERWFDENHMVGISGKTGTNYYHIVLPTDKVYNLRFDFGEYPDTVTIHDIYLMGTQAADLNDFDNYKFNQIDEFTINKDGSLTLVSEQRDPFMIYNRDLAQ